MFGEPVKPPADGLGRPQCVAERGREVTQYADFGSARRGVPPAFCIFRAERSCLLRSDQLFRILGGPAPPRGPLGFPYPPFPPGGGGAGPGHPPHPPPPPLPPPRPRPAAALPPNT